MTEHDFIQGPVVSTPGLVGKDKAQQQSFVCTLCRRTTTTPDKPEGACPGPSGLGPERTQYLQLCELRAIRAGVANLIRHADDISDGTKAVFTKGGA